MNFSSLSEVASFIVSDGKGILAADESNPTCTKRFDSIGVESPPRIIEEITESCFLDLKA